MNLLSITIWASLIGTPISVGTAWWLWAGSERSGPQEWRNLVLLAGLLAASTNVLMYYSWLIYRAVANDTSMVWKTKGLCGDIGMFLSLLVLGGAIFGTGVSRVPLAFSALFGFLLWVSFGVL